MARKVKEIDLINKQIGNKIRELRISEGLSRQELAEKIYVTHQQLKKYEDNDNRVSAARLKAIAIALNKSVSYFYEEDLDANGNSEVFPVENQRMCIELARNFMKIENSSYKEAVNDLVRNLAKKIS
jgi:transcriptional regulator with XRE-family HTH domain